MKNKSDVAAKTNKPQPAHTFQADANDPDCCHICGRQHKASHTPGPWFVEECGLGSYLVVMEEEGGEDCAQMGVTVDQRRGHDARANARLIAAAPTMLAMLKKIASQHACEQFAVFTNGEESCELCAVIAQAEGATK